MELTLATTARPKALVEGKSLLEVELGSIEPRSMTHNNPVMPVLIVKKAILGRATYPGNW